METNWHLLFAIVASTLGSAFQYGYNIGVINSPHQLIKDFIKDVMSNRSSVIEDRTKEISNSVIILIWSVTVSIFCVGGMVGSVMTGIVTDKFGLKLSLILNNIFVFGGALSQGLSKISKSYELIILGRFLVGISAGLSTGLGPMYLSEISPTHLRGTISSVYPLVLVISIFISQLLGLSVILGSADLWPILLAFTAVPGLFMVATLPFCPESPKFLLIRRGKHAEAEKSLVWLRGMTEVQQEMEEIKKEQEEIEKLPKVTLKDMFMKKSLRLPLIIGVVLMVALQFAGINAIFAYSADIFLGAGFSTSDSQYATLAIGFANIPTYVFLLPLVEMAGRKTLLLIGFGGMFIATILLTVCLHFSAQYNSTWLSYCCVGLVLIYVIHFAIGPGAVPLVIINEIFGQSARPLACSISFFFSWLAYFVVTLGFLPLKEAIGVSVLFLFVLCHLTIFIFIWKVVPETKQKPISEITALFEARAMHRQTNQE